MRNRENSWNPLDPKLGRTPACQPFLRMTHYSITRKSCSSPEPAENLTDLPLGMYVPSSTRLSLGPRAVDLLGCRGPT